MLTRAMITEFIRIFENETCLWKIGSKYYHDRTKRDAAYSRLVEKLQEVDPNATKDDVVKKINNMRSALRKEYKKIKLSLISGADSVYKPRLWYFSLFSFLNDQDARRTSSSNMESDDESIFEEVPFIEQLKQENQHQSNASISTSVSSTAQSQCRKRAFEEYDSEEVTKEVLEQVNDYFKRPRIEKDRFDVIGKLFAIKLRSLPRDQMLLAERIINDTLFQAELGTLTLSHTLVGEQSSSHLPTSPATAENQHVHVSQQTLGPHHDFHQNVQQHNNLKHQLM